MPRTANKEDERMSFLSGMIDLGMKTSRTDIPRMAKVFDVQERSIRNRIKDPGTMSVRDFWTMCDMLGLKLEVSLKKIPE